MDEAAIRSQAEALIQEFIDEGEALKSQAYPTAADINFKIWESRVTQALGYYFGVHGWQFQNFHKITFSDTEYVNGRNKYSAPKFKRHLADGLVVLRKIMPFVGYAAIQKEKQTVPNQARKPRKVFVSHGRNEVWRELQHYLMNDQEIDTLELSQQPNRGRTVINKLNEVSEQCSFAVIVMTGDNLDIDGKPYARENVMHEIGFFQGKYGLDRVCILYETGTNIPSNLSGVVYVEFPKGIIKASFPELLREIKAAFDENE